VLARPDDTAAAVSLDNGQSGPVVRSLTSGRSDMISLRMAIEFETLTLS